MANSYSYYRALSLVEENIVASVPVFDDEPIVFSERHKQFMQKLFKKMNGGRYRSSSRVVFRVLVAAAVLLSIATTVIGFPRTEEYTVIDYGVSSEYVVTADVDDTPVKNMKIGYLPDGFNMVEESIGQYMISYLYEFNGDTIYLAKTDMRTHINFDSENSSVETISADGLEYVCCYGNEYNNFIWNDGKYIYVVKTTVDKDEGLKIVRHLK